MIPTMYVDTLPDEKRCMMIREWIWSIFGRDSVCRYLNGGNMEVWKSGKFLLSFNRFLPATMIYVQLLAFQKRINPDSNE